MPGGRQEDRYLLSREGRTLRLSDTRDTAQSLTERQNTDAPKTEPNCDRQVPPDASGAGKSRRGKCSQGSQRIN